ncbi:MAG: hypothetical protein ACI3W7_02590 [Oscillospiraceae bacterium]
MDEMDMTRMRSKLSGFDGVWQRVNGSSSAEKSVTSTNCGGMERTLLELMKGERELCRMYRCLGLTEFARCAKQRAARLAAEYFLLTGKRPECSETESMERMCRIDALRHLMLRALALADSYCAADRRTEDRELSALLSCFAEQNKQAAARLRCMILSQFA